MLPTPKGGVQTMNGRRLIGITELANMLGIKVTTLYCWVSQRRIPSVKVGRLRKFDPLVIDELIKNGEVGR